MGYHIASDMAVSSVHPKTAIGLFSNSFLNPKNECRLATIDSAELLSSEAARPEHSGQGFLAELRRSQCPSVNGIERTFSCCVRGGGVYAVAGHDVMMRWA